MNKTTEALRAKAAELLQSKEVELIIGFGPGSEAVRTQPVFITSPDEVEKLVWNPFCVNNLTKYLVDLKSVSGRIAVCVKGCDSRSINRLIQDNMITRDKVMVLGIPCRYQLSYTKLASRMDVNGSLLSTEEIGEELTITTSQGKFVVKKEEVLLDRCKNCDGPNPVSVDQLIGEPVSPDAKQDGFAAVKQMEAMTTSEKEAFWQSQFERCIRCYACRNVCPGCTCVQCVFDAIKPDWAGKEVNVSENELFHLTRAFHLAGRCVDCGECDRVCPMDIPLRLLNKKVLMDCKELFAVETPGMDETGKTVLGQFRQDDPEEFM